MSEKHGNFGKTLFVGIAAAITALLLAPKSGKELRKDIKEQVNSVKEQAMDKAAEFADEIKESYREVEEEINYTDPDLAQTIDDIEADIEGTTVTVHPDSVPTETLQFDETVSSFDDNDEDQKRSPAF